MRRFLILTLLLAACASTEIRLSIGTGFIEGQVSTSQGDPVTGALVVAEATRTPFGQAIATDSARTDANGRYALTLTTDEVVDGDGLLTLTVTPPDGSPLQAARRTALPLGFSPTGVATDTTRADFALSYLPD